MHNVIGKPHSRRAREALKQCLPESMRKNTIKNGIFRTDLATQSYLQRLIKHVDSPHLNDDKLEPLTHWKIILDTINLYVGGS